MLPTDLAPAQGVHHYCTIDATRRVALRRAVALAACCALPVRAQLFAPSVTQPAASSRQSFMDRAFEMRRISIERGDQPYGAVIVKARVIVGEGVSAVITHNDPTAHAEMQAIRDAARRLGTRDLTGCDMYGTSRACPMCEAAAYWARVTSMVHGASMADAGAPRLP